MLDLVQLEGQLAEAKLSDFLLSSYTETGKVTFFSNSIFDPLSNQISTFPIFPKYYTGAPK